MPRLADSKAIVVAVVVLAVIVLVGVSVLIGARHSAPSGSQGPGSAEPIVIDLAFGNNSTRQAGHGTVFLLVFNAHTGLVADDLQMCYAEDNKVSGLTAVVTLWNSTGSALATYNSSGASWSQYGQSPFMGWGAGASTPVLAEDVLSLNPPASADALFVGFSLPGTSGGTGSMAVQFSP